jgi:hypothetical protein
LRAHVGRRLTRDGGRRSRRRRGRGRRGGGGLSAGEESRANANDYCRGHGNDDAASDVLSTLRVALHPFEFFAAGRFLPFAFGSCHGFDFSWPPKAS